MFGPSILHYVAGMALSGVTGHKTNMLNIEQKLQIVQLVWENNAPLQHLIMDIFSISKSSSTIVGTGIASGCMKTT